MPTKGHNRIPWLKCEDYVLIDGAWFDQRKYRLKKSLNDLITKDARRTGILRVVYVSPQGQSLKLKRTHQSRVEWALDYPLSIQLAHHSSVHPATFSSRCVNR